MRRLRAWVPTPHLVPLHLVPSVSDFRSSACSPAESLGNRPTKLPLAAYTGVVKLKYGERVRSTSSAPGRLLWGPSVLRSHGLAAIQPRLRRCGPRTRPCHRVLHVTVLVPGCPMARAKGVFLLKALSCGQPLPGCSPVRGGQVLLLLEFLLQAHELQLREDGATPAGFLLPRGELLRLRLAAA